MSEPLRMNPESNNPMAVHGDEGSALACVLAAAIGKPVLFEEDKSGTDKKKCEPPYRIIEGNRL